MASVVHVAGRLDVAALGAAVNELTRRHEVLRSSFGHAHGRLSRSVAAPVEFEVAPGDLAVGADADEAVRAALSDDLRAPFDLASGPLLRVRLLRLNSDEHVLALVIHHIVADGWSLHVLWRELAALYGACTSGQLNPLPELRTGYDTYVTWQRRRLEGERLSRLLHYWSERLHGVPELLLPSDWPRCAETSARSARERFVFTGTQVEGLRRLCQGCGVTAGVALLAVFNVLLYQLAGTPDVAIGMPVADRNRPEFEPLVGLLLNVTVLRTDLSGDPTFVELLERVRRTFIGAYDHRELPHGCLAGLHGLPGELSVAPLRVIFNFVVAREAAPSLPGVNLRRVEVDGAPPSFADLSLHVFDRDGALNGFVLYKADLFTSARVRELIVRFTRILSDVIGAPHSRISAYGATCA
jgi:hypothetical protein